MRDQRIEASSRRSPAITAVVAVILAIVVGIGYSSATPAAADGEVTIEVLANGQPADLAPGPEVASGETVELQYIVTIVTTETLYDFVVTNLTGDVVPSCDVDGDGQPDGDNSHPGGKGLASGDSFTCVGSVVAGDAGATYASIGRVTAYNEAITETFTHDDAAHYTTVSPTTTQAPTTEAPTTTASPVQPTTTAPATTRPPSTATPTTLETSSSTPTTEAATTDATTSKSDTTRSTTSTTMPSTESQAVGDRATTAAQNTDSASPKELAATDEESDGPPIWWIVLAFGIGGAISAGVGSHLADKNATAPDQ